MPVNVIGTLKPKNNGKFPVAEAVDIKVTDDLRLDEALESKADLSTVNYVLNNKADKTTTDSLQNQINNIIEPVTEDAEVQNARVDLDGVSHTTLKERLDSDTTATRKALSTCVLSIPSTIINGKYVRYDTGAIDTLSGWNYAEFSVYPGEVFEYNATRTSPDIRGLAFYNSDGNFISGVQIIETAQTITVPNNAALCRASFTNNQTIEINTDAFELKNDINEVKKISVSAESLANELLDELTVSVSVSNFQHIADSYIRDTGVIGYDSNGTVDYFMCEKNTIYEITTTIVASSFRAGWTTENPRQNVQAYGIVANSTGNKIVIKTGENASYLVFGRRTADTDTTVIAKVNKVTNLSLRLSPLYAFTNITCIGDSLTHGVVTTDSQGGYRIAKYPYPAVLQRITGATVEEIAHGGYSASDWWGAYSESITSKTNQLALVFLGTNDGLTDTIDTDCAGDDYTTYANTDTGCYGKILGKLKEVGAKIVLIQCFTGDNNYRNTNDVIQQFADKFGCGIIATQRLTNPAYHYYPDLSGSDTLHFNDLGYSAFAEFIINQISDMNSDYLKYIIPE